MKRSPSPSRQASLFTAPTRLEPQIADGARKAVVEALAELLLEAAGRGRDAKEEGDEPEDHE